MLVFRENKKRFFRKKWSSKVVLLFTSLLKNLNSPKSRRKYLEGLSEYLITPLINLRNKNAYKTNYRGHRNIISSFKRVGSIIVRSQKEVDDSTSTVRRRCYLCNRKDNDHKTVFFVAKLAKIRFASRIDHFLLIV